MSVRRGDGKPLLSYCSIGNLLDNKSISISNRAIMTHVSYSY